MPAGVPVATVALDGARNAGILAAQIVAAGDDELLKRIAIFKENLKEKVMQSLDANGNIRS
jgi:5-(carboxyamino)imidazole ribonucleotide mutase